MQASAPAFDRDFPLIAGMADRVSDRVTRVLAPNPSAYTFTGTVSYIVGAQDVTVIDPGPADETHLEALMAALDGRRAPPWHGGRSRSCAMRRACLRQFMSCSNHPRQRVRRLPMRTRQGL